MKTVLIFAYYFPPMGLGGVQRIQKFVKYLPQYGWRPIVLTVNEVQYYDRDETLLDELPQDTSIYRTGSLDPLRLAYKLRGPRARSTSHKPARGHSLARWVLFPDSQIGWVPFAIAKAYRLIREERVDAIFSSFPPASGHLAASIVHRSTHIPWVADFRDTWIGGEFDQTPSVLHRTMMQWLQRTIVQRTTHLTGVSNEIITQLSAIRGDAGNTTVITNGYDPDDFTGLTRSKRATKFVLTYCGTLNTARNPEPLFKALRLFCNKNPELPDQMEVRLIGTAIGLDLEALIHYYRLENLVRPFGYLTHRDALSQVIDSDALLMFITSEHKKVRGVPTGKLYECLGAGRPILGIAPDGILKETLHTYQRGTSVSPENIEGIANIIEDWHLKHQAGNLPIYPIDEDRVKTFSRPYLTEQLARILDHVIDS